MIEHPPHPCPGVGAVVWRRGEVLLIRRGKPPHAGAWSLPGGRQEWGETLEAAVRREVREETGLGLGPLRLVAAVDLIERDATGEVVRHYSLIDYTAEAEHGEAIAGSDAAAVAWFPLEALAGLGLWSRTLDVIDEARRRRARG